MHARYDVVLAEPDAKDPARTYWTRVGVAFPLKEREGFKLILKPGLSVGGEVLLFPVKPEGRH